MEPIIAAYPTNPPHKTFTIKAEQYTGRLMADGSTRGQFWDAYDAWRLRIVHTAITSSELTVLDTFYETNYNITNTIIYDGETYSFRFDGGFKIIELSSTLLTAEVLLKAWK